MFKLDLDPLAPRLLKNRNARIDYLKYTQEQADILRGIVEQAKARQPLDNELDFVCKHAKRIQELLVYVRDTCPNANKPSEKMVAVTPMNKVKKVRITSTKVVPINETTSHSVETQKPEIKVYSRRPKQVKSIGSPDCSLVSRLRMLKTYDGKPLSAHELRSRDTNLYTISLDDMLKTSPIYLLVKASNTKSCLWHRWLSHLNFGTLNKLAKDGLVRGIPKLKFKKDHLCSTCALGKSIKSSHQPKAKDTNQEKLYLLHMDLCGPMCVESINGKKYILVIVDDYSRFTWVKFLRPKDEAPDAIIKCIKNIQVRLNATVRNVRTYNGTKLSIRLFENFMKMSASRIKHMFLALLNKMALSKDETGL
ncbi:retrovirus-related pol polyprotein from transposon TNT 1-94 [Tanacetum coccineum]